MAILQNVHNDRNTFVTRSTRGIQSPLGIKVGDSRGNCEPTLLGAHTDQNPEHSFLKKFCGIHGRRQIGEDGARGNPNSRVLSVRRAQQISVQ